jgi:type IV pilus biogenesis protein CpaD/CtpE
MPLGCPHKAALLGACLAGLSGCTDLQPMQAQIDDLQLRLDEVQKDAKAAVTTANASAAATQKTIRQVQSATQSNAKAITALSDKIDQMFKRPLAKQAASEQPPPP